MVRSEVIELMQEMFLFQLDGNQRAMTSLRPALWTRMGIRLMRCIQDKYGIAFTKEELLSNIITRQYPDLSKPSKPSGTIVA